MSELSFGIEFLPAKKVDKIVSHSKLAENVGVDYIWVTDHYNNRNVYATLTAIAYNTSRIKLGPGITNPYVINPCWTAAAISTIDEISNGRAILGIGAGDRITLESIGVKWEKPLTTVKESVHIIRKLLDGERVTYDGSAFKVSGAKLYFKPVSRVPIYIGAQAPKMLRLSAKIADGVLINASHPIDFEHALQHVKAGLKEREVKTEKFDVVAYVAMSIDRDEKKAIDAVKIVVAFIVGGAPQTVLERHNVDVNVTSEISKAIGKGDFGKAMSLVDNNMIESFSITGTPDQVLEKIRNLFNIGVTQIVAGSPIGPDVNESIKLYGEIIKMLRG